MNKDIKDYAHLYLGCDLEIIEPSSWGETRYAEKVIAVTTESINTNNFEYSFDYDNDISVRLILRPLSDMTEEEFKEFAGPGCFASHNGYWYVCERELDPEFEGDVLEHIHETCDDDPEQVIMYNTRSTSISFGWIEYEERYHGFDTQMEANWIKFLLSKGFDVFGLIKSGLAIDKTTLS